jgi:hypothetical protein
MQPLAPQLRRHLREIIRAVGKRGAARLLDVDRSLVDRALAGRPLHAGSHLVLASSMQRIELARIAEQAQ